MYSLRESDFLNYMFASFNKVLIKLVKALIPIGKAP